MPSRFISATRALLAFSVATLGATTLAPHRASAADEPAQDAADAAPEGTEASGTPSVAECLQAHVAGQELRQEGQLLESRSRFMECAQATCPELVRAECLQFYDELRAQVPSIVFRVTVDGEPRYDVSAFVGDRQLFSELPTRALDFDPGKYRFRFEHAGLPPIEREVTITIGDKFLAVVAEFKSPREEPPPAVEPAPSMELSRPVPWPVYALGGVGIAGVGAFVGFGLATRGKENDLKSSCAPTCSEAQIDSVRHQALLADLSLAVGGAALVAAAGYYYFRPTESVRVSAIVLPTGGVESKLTVGF